MPVLSSLSSLEAFINNRGANNASLSSAVAKNTTHDVLQVVCAWPVSGQYGPGSRVLYYVLVVACVFARKAEWLRNACLAAALLFPAVAALHGIVLATIHIEGAVDMDVYGAFQLCSIGILAGPVTVRLSQTYFNEDGRNIIFLWTGLILAGLLSLTIEFTRTKAVDCSEFGNPLSASDFQYGTSNCSLRCTVADGPTSPIRGGSANNIYVLPAPEHFTFGTATLLAAACCVPAILSIVTIMFKVLDEYKKKPGDEPSEDTNDATPGEMNKINKVTRLNLHAALEIPFFSAAVLAILILGERNFFSQQVRYQTEPIASIGQWAPIVGTGLAALGSLYLLLAKDMKAVGEGASQDYELSGFPGHCNCSHHSIGCPTLRTTRLGADKKYSPGSGDARSFHSDLVESPLDETDLRAGETSLLRSSTQIHDNPASTDVRPDLLHRDASISTEATPTRRRRASGNDAGSRRKVAKALTKMGNIIGAAANDRFSESEFKQGEARTFPEFPGEMYKNEALLRIRKNYNKVPHQTPPPRSLTGSVASGSGVEKTPRMSSPRSPQSRSTVPAETPTRTHSSNSPGEQIAFHQQIPHSDSSPGPSRQRSNTLEVPVAVYGNWKRFDYSKS